MNISAAELVKRSTSQLLYKEIKRIEWQATPRQHRGNNYADEIVAKEKASSEKRGVVKLKDDNLLFFCIDLVKDNKYVEIKMVENMNDYPDWYFHSSIMQATFYASLIEKTKSLDTPKFRRKEGYKQEVINIHPNPEFELWFGEDKYKVYPNANVYNHYIKKANVFLKSIDEVDFDKCRSFDSNFKHKEFNLFRPKYIKL